MIGFLGGYFQADMVNDPDEFSCFKYAVDLDRFGKNYDLILQHIKDNADHFQWDAREIGLNIHEMAEGLFKGMRDHDGKAACKSSNSTIQRMIDAFSTQSMEFSRLKFDNKIPAIEDLRCSKHWWLTDTETILYSEYLFYSLESQS